MKRPKTAIIVPYPLPKMRTARREEAYGKNRVSNPVGKRAEKAIPLGWLKHLMLSGSIYQTIVGVAEKMSVASLMNLWENGR
jgi:hypothetical protein